MRKEPPSRVGLTKARKCYMKNTKPTVNRTNHVSSVTPRKANYGGAVAGLLLGFALLHSPASALAVVPSTGMTGLAWDSSPSSGVAGYRVYLGTASGNYTSSVEAGTATTTTIPNLLSGTTYFFAVKAYNASGVESAFSNEISFVPGVATLQLTVTASGQPFLTVKGLAGHTYEVQATRDLRTWSVLGNVTAGSNGIVTYADNPAVVGLKRFYRTRDLQP